MPGTVPLLLPLLGVAALLAAVLWLAVHGIRRRWAQARLAEIQHRYDDLKAALWDKGMVLLTHFSNDQVLTENGRDTMDWAFGQIEKVLDRQQDQESARIPAAGNPPVTGPALLAVGGVALLISATVYPS